MANEQNLRPPWKPGESGNPNGRPKGRKSLSTVVRELESEDFDWDSLPVYTSEIEQAVKSLKKYGSPWRALVIRAFLDALAGDKHAMEYLRKSGYGDKLDVTSDGKQIMAPIIISEIKPRNAQTETETEASS